MQTMYHINYEGKVMPCRAVVRECPYGNDRHSYSRTDLYMRFQDKYSSNLTPPTIKKKLEEGNRYDLGTLVNDAVSKSNAPCETICSILQTAYKNAGKGNINSKDQDAWDEGVYKVKTLLDAGHYPPRRIPDEMVDEAQAQVRNSLWDAISHVDEKRHAMEGSWDYLVEHTRDINRINKLRHEHPQMSREDIQNYKDNIAGWYAHYADLLNTRKLISQPAVHAKDSTQLLTTLDTMSTEDLQSLYDDCNIESKDLEQRLSDAYGFQGEINQLLSDEANDSINRWADKAREALKRYRIESAERIVISLSAANVLKRRGVLFSDTQNDDK